MILMENLIKGAFFKNEVYMFHIISSISYLLNVLVHRKHMHLILKMSLKILRFSRENFFCLELIMGISSMLNTAP